MDPGRSLDLNRGMTTVTATWRGSSDAPSQYTNPPIIVIDENEEGDQPIRPEEAEDFMEMGRGFTAAPGMSNKARLSAIGNGWHHKVVGFFFRHLLQYVTASSRAAVATAKVDPWTRTGLGPRRYRPLAAC